MISVFLVSIVIAWIVCENIGIQYFRKTVAVYYIAWHLPFALALFLPFDVPINLSYAGVITTLIIVHSIPLCCIDVLSNLALKNGNPFYSLTAAPRYIYLLSYIGAFFLYLDLYCIRGLSFFFGVEQNREIYSDSMPTIFGYVAICLTALPFLIIQSLDLYKENFIKISVRYMPYIITSVLYMLSGNRQYMFFGIFISVLTYAYYKKEGLSKFLIKLFLFSLAFSGAMLIYQFARQQSTADSQYLLVQKILQLDITQDYYTDSTITFLAYIFAYFGIEYQSISYFLTDIRNTFHAPFMSLTFPIFYRRVYPFLEAQDLDSIVETYKYSVFTATGMDPLFWISAIAQLYLEGGWFWLIFYYIVLIVILRYFLIKYFADSNARIGVTTLFACLIYNIMSSFTTDLTFTLTLFFAFLLTLYPKTGKRFHNA